MSEPAVMPADVHLHPGREKHLLRGHPWVFSGAIHRVSVDDSAPAAGDWVRVFGSEGQPLGWGHWGEGSIAVRLLAEGTLPAPPTDDWWTERFKRALDVRRAIGLEPNSQRANTSCFRLVHGEGDRLSGLVIDLYGTMAVVQTHTMGMHRDWPYIATGLRSALGPDLDLIVNKSAALIAKVSGSVAATAEDGIVWSSKEGATTEREVMEHGLRYLVDPVGGQKTGFFLDQRDNRKLLMEWAGERAVLNAFSYTGGFSMAALKGGSPHVISLDASGPAIDAANRHAEMNGFSDRHEGVRGDVMDYLRQASTLPPVVILDPPAYAKSRSNRHKAVQGYKRLNAMSLGKMPPDGLLWTFSCSQVLETPLFEDTIVAAAMESGRTVRIVRRLSQPGDHPALAGHPEAQYLKGLVLHVS